MLIETQNNFVLNIKIDSNGFDNIIIIEIKFSFYFVVYLFIALYFEIELMLTQNVKKYLEQNFIFELVKDQLVIFI